MSEDERRKIAMFCNVEAKNVIAFRDVKNTIYECPLDLSQDKIDRIVTRRLGLTFRRPTWRTGSVTSAGSSAPATPSGLP